MLPGVCSSPIMAATSCRKIARASKRGSRSGWFRSNSIKIDSAIQPTPRTCLKTLGDLLAAGRCSARGAFSELRNDTTSQ
jgi:hypothetical protein